MIPRCDTIFKAAVDLTERVLSFKNNTVSFCGNDLSVRAAILFPLTDWREVKFRSFL
jgi:hypothetical protein